MKTTRPKLGDDVHYEVDGAKPARNPNSVFGFNLISPVGRKLGSKVKKAKSPKEKPKEFEP